MKGIAEFKKRLLTLAGNNQANVINTLLKDVKKCGAKNIAFRHFNVPAAGISKENGDVFISDDLMSLSDIIFITMHESAHQLQYRKYGADHATDIWYDALNNGALSTASKVKHIEDIANRYAFIKFKQYQAQFGLCDISYHIKMSAYMPDYAYVANMDMFIGMLKRKGVNTKEALKNELNNYLK
jgi:hypothetical protein